MSKASDTGVSVFLSIGIALAVSISWGLYHSIGWAFLHGVFAWFYVIYYGVFL